MIVDEIYIELSIPEALRVIEATVKFLNKKNNDTQQYIRSNKDKDNQMIVDRIVDYFEKGVKSPGNAPERDEYRHVYFPIAQIIKDITGKVIRVKE